MNKNKKKPHNNKKETEVFLVNNKINSINKEDENEIKSFDFRTDLASERRDLYKKANKIENEINGIESEKNEIDEKISVEKVKITNEEGEKAIRKANR